MKIFELFGKIGLDTKDYEKGIDVTEKKTKGLAGKIGGGFKKAGAIAVKGLAVATTAIAGMTAYSIKNYAEYEQLVGGVETLFGTGGASLEDYADKVGKSVDDAKEEYNKLQKAQTTVLNYSKEAFKTAGMSANEYMETVTGFSASLIQSLGGDTEKASEVANQAVIDMSDNANKMGTSMESIQFAYQGFAKQNYTMLDNLKLGYGGTKSEMERLIEDANRVKEANGEMANLSINSFADVTEAIHIIQGEMGITGTTALEAEHTISGSIGMLKASFTNLVTGIADDNADFDKLMDDFTESVIAVGDNLLPRIQTAVKGVGKMFQAFATKLLPKIIDAITENFPAMAEAGVETLVALLNGLASALPQLAEKAPEIITTILDTIDEHKWEILEAGGKIVLALLEGIVNSWWQLSDWVGQKISDLFDIEERARERNQNDHKGNPTGKDTYKPSANGIFYVPYDGYKTELHKGERVLTASENENITGKGVTIVQNIYSKAQTSADLMQEAMYQQERGLFFV